MHELRSISCRFGRGALAAAALALTLPVVAQTSAGGSTSSNSSWWMPGSGRTLLGLNLGRSDYRVPCGTGFACDDTDRYVSLYGRNMASDYWGSELAIVNMGRIDRAGGSTRAYGVNLSLVGRLPLAEKFSAFGKLGATYGRTRTSADPISGITAGDENGFGVSYGAGLSWDFTPKLSAVLEWDRYDFRFEDGRDAVRAASVGLQYRY